jgi:hypothetical protein
MHVQEAQDTSLQQLIAGELDWDARTDILSGVEVRSTFGNQFGLYATRDLEAGHILLMSKAIWVRILQCSRLPPHARRVQALDNANAMG